MLRTPALALIRAAHNNLASVGEKAVSSPCWVYLGGIDMHTASSGSLFKANSKYLHGNHPDITLAYKYPTRLSNHFPAFHSRRKVASMTCGEKAI